MSDLLAIGEPLVELNQAKDGEPFLQGFGGDTSNAMIAAARLGADAAYFTAIGADRFGQALTELWMKEGVDASRVVINGGAHTGLYFVTHGPEGHQFSYMRAGSAASRIGESDLPGRPDQGDADPASLRHQPGDLVLGGRRRLRRDGYRP